MIWAIGASDDSWAVDPASMSDWVRKEWPQASEARGSELASRAIVWTWPDSFEVALNAKLSGLTFTKPDTNRLAEFALRFYEHFSEGHQLVLASGAGNLIDLRTMRDEAQLIAAIDALETDE